MTIQVFEKSLTFAQNVMFYRKSTISFLKKNDLNLNQHMPHSNDPGKDNIIMITEDNSTPQERESWECPYYIVRIQGCFIRKKDHHLHHRFKVDRLDNANSINTFDWFVREGPVDHFHWNLRLDALTHNVAYALATLRIHNW